MEDILRYLPKIFDKNGRFRLVSRFWPPTIHQHPRGLLFLLNRDPAYIRHCNGAKLWPDVVRCRGCDSIYHINDTRLRHYDVSGLQHYAATDSSCQNFGLVWVFEEAITTSFGQPKSQRKMLMIWPAKSVVVVSQSWLKYIPRSYGTSNGIT